MDRFDEIGEAFLRASQNENMAPTPEAQGLPFPSYLCEEPVNPESLISLPRPDTFDLGDLSFRELAEQRRSIRRYDTEAWMTLPELAWLLWITQGIKRVSEKSGLTLRTVPSAGCRHPFETYLGVQRVEGVAPGIYHYVAHLHALEPFSLLESALPELTEAAKKQNHVLTSAVTFMWAAVPYRTSWRYGTRAYRYMHLDAGHVCQNLYLAAEAIGHGVCAIAAFDDELANALLNLDGREKFVIYMASVGKKLPQPGA